jgi:glutaconate CoA-transferase, subunit B
MKTEASNTISSGGYTAGELMVAAAAREIRDTEIVFVGMRLPLLAFAVAKRTHAPNAIGLFENGIIRETPSRELLYTMADPPNLRGATLAGAMIDVMGLLQQGRVNVGFLGAAEVDRFGNLNTTLVKGKDRETRLPGSGGACDIACMAQRIVVLLEHDKRRFVERVHYVTSPSSKGGSGVGQKRWQISMGRHTRSVPGAIITTLGVLRFATDNGEAFLASVHPGVKLEDVLTNTGWQLQHYGNPPDTAPPTAEELEAMGELDPEGFWTGK